MSYIALQRESAYHAAGNSCFARMTDRPGILPKEAEEVSTGGFNRYVGPMYRLPDADGGAVRRFAFVIAEKHMNAAGSAHGGMLMTLADVAMSRTSRLATGARDVSTVSLNCDFVGPGRLGDLVEARVCISRSARTMVFLSAELYAGERLLLVASGLWKIAVES
jgi:acyl-coenzyme A thioesterase 13